MHQQLGKYENDIKTKHFREHNIEHVETFLKHMNDTGGEVKCSGRVYYLLSYLLTVSVLAIVLALGPVFSGNTEKACSCHLSSHLTSSDFNVNPYCFSTLLPGQY